MHQLVMVKAMPQIATESPLYHLTSYVSFNYIHLFLPTYLSFNFASQIMNIVPKIMLSVKQVEI